MRSYLISDNQETLVGMRLAGISGCILSESSEIVKKIDTLIRDPQIGIIMVTMGIMRLAEEEIMDRKMKASETLIVQIPDAETQEGEDRITKYIRESIGLKL